MAHLKNQLNKEQALEKLSQETFKRRTLSFYRYVGIEDPQAMRDQLFLQWDRINCLGRIYVAKEGINAQMNVPEHHWDTFVQELYSLPEFKDVPFKIALEEPDYSFLKLAIKVKDKIVADGINDPGFDSSNCGEHLDAKAFNEAIESGATVMDMRNHYESEVGKFEGALCPDADTFREELPMAVEMLEGKEEEPILMYCTGGIRCEKASAYLKHRGFKKVYQLEGGIIQYAHEVKQKGLESKFLGKNFVFDDRMGERITDDVIATCHQCEAACDKHVNCANKHCHLLFIQCGSCVDKYEGHYCGDLCKVVDEQGVEAAADLFGIDVDEAENKTKIKLGLKDKRQDHLQVYKHRLRAKI